MGTFLVGVLVFGGAALVCRSLWRQRSAARASGEVMCGGACSGCAGCAVKNKK